jgi:hypothetical protein
MVKDYYFLLGVPRRAPLADVKAAYRRLAAQYHPDKLAAEAPEVQEAANARMTELNEAIAILSDPARCEQYHQLLDLIPERKPEEPHPFTRSQPAAVEEDQAVDFSAAGTGPLPPLQEPEGGRTLMREEEGRKLKEGLRRLPLKWREAKFPGWQWVLETGSTRRAVLVAYRHLENLSLLSVRTLVRGVEALIEDRKLALRPTAVIAMVSYERLMDSQAVQEQLQAAVSGRRGWLKMVHPMLILHEGKTQRSHLLGVQPEDIDTRRVVHYLGRSGAA